MKTIDWYAKKYIETFGMRLVPLEPGRKFPKKKNWGEDCISEISEAVDFFKNHPKWGLGAALGPSRLCSLDVDNYQCASLIFASFGIDIDRLILETPTIKGRGFRITFRVPDGISLPYRRLTWPSKNDPTGEKHRAAMLACKKAKDSNDTKREERIRLVAKRWASFCVFELRSATENDKQRLDVLPPTIHPETGKPYVWHTQPKKDWPEPPKWLIAMWQEWDRIKPQIMAACPWTVAPEVPETRIQPRAKYTPGASVIDQYCRAFSIDQALQNYGYERKGKRYLSPHSGTGLPGVSPLRDGQSVYIHHASDPLCSVESGHPVNAFDLYCYYEHAGDVSKAVKAAAGLLGISTPARHNQATVDMETGEVISQPDSPAVHEESVGRDIYTPLPWTNGKGKPKAHIENLAEIVKRLGITIRYNVIRKDEEILIPRQRFTRDNEANASLAWLGSECSLFDFPTAKLGEFVTYLADQNPYNPVMTWIKSKPWDGTDRMPEFYATLTADGEHDPAVASLKQTLMLRWMVSAVAAVARPDGVSAAGVLVLQGDQYLGKTKWFKTLVPGDLDLIKDGMLLRPDDKDSVKQCVSYWLVELGELDATFRRSDIAALKSFLTNDRDVLRRAYARRESEYARRTVFFGSVNPRDYLHDPTGNRRYWTIACTKINHSHGLDMQQVWAQVLSMYEQGESYYLKPDEMDALNRHNQDFSARDPVEEKIESGLHWDDPQHLWTWKTATEIAGDIGFDNPSKQVINTLSAHIRKLNGAQEKRTNKGRFLLCPTRVFS